MKRNLIFCFLLIFLISMNISSATENECEIGGGTWITPTISPGDDPNEKILQPYCSCDTGFFWHESSKKCGDDSEIRCIQTQGEWINGECNCPEETIKWTPGFGCDTEGPIALAENNSYNLNNKEKSYMSGVIAVVLIFAISFIIFYILKHKKRKKENG